MPLLQISVPSEYLADLNGDALDGGYVYIGEPNQDPELFPKAVFWDAEGTEPATQPLRTIDGYVARDGSPASPHTDGAYSVRVRNRLGGQISYAADVEFILPTGIVEADNLIDTDTGLLAITDKIRFIQTGGGTEYRTVLSKLRERYSTKDYGAIGDGVVDDYDAIMAAHDNAPDGATILVRGPHRFTKPLVFTRRLNWICEGPGDYFKPDGLTTSQDCITITGTSSHSPAQIKINLYNGAFDTCQNGLVLQNFNNSEVTANVAVGGTAYNFVARGCLLTKFNLTSSVNYTNPLGSAYLCPNHLKIERYNSIANNANQYDIRFEGRVNGVIIDDQSNEGDSTFSGTIEGLSGTPFAATSCIGLSLKGLHFEGNPIASAFTSCQNLCIKNVENISSATIALYACRGTYVNNYTGGLSIDAACIATRIGVMRKSVNTDVLADASTSTEMTQGMVLPSTSDALDGGAGASAQDNLFFNPFCDIYDAGTAAAPTGFTIGSGSIAKEVGAVFPGNPKGVSAFVASTATTLTNAFRMTPTSDVAVSEERWYSSVVWVFVPTGQPDLNVTMFNGLTYLGGTLVTAKATWVPVRMSVRVPGGTVPSVVALPYNGTAFVAGNFVVGGMSLVYGIVAPKYLFDSGRREAHYPASIGFQPSFVGQEALVGGAWYKAIGTSSAGDWMKITP